MIIHYYVLIVSWEGAEVISGCKDCGGLGGSCLCCLRAVLGSAVMKHGTFGLYVLFSEMDVI